MQVETRGEVVDLSGIDYPTDLESTDDELVECEPLPIADGGVISDSDLASEAKT